MDCIIIGGRYIFYKVPDKRILGQPYYSIPANRVLRADIKEMGLRLVDTEPDFISDSYWYADSIAGIYIWKFTGALIRFIYWPFLRFLYNRLQLFRKEEAACFSWTTVKWFWQKEYYAIRRRD